MRTTAEERKRRLLADLVDARQLIVGAVSLDLLAWNSSKKLDIDTGSFNLQAFITATDTGVGKTYTSETLSNLVGVPFVVEDMTKFSEVGYVGALTVVAAIPVSPPCGRLVDRSRRRWLLFTGSLLLALSPDRALRGMLELAHPTARVFMHHGAAMKMDEYVPLKRPTRRMTANSCRVTPPKSARASRRNSTVINWVLMDRWRVWTME